MGASVGRIPLWLGALWLGALWLGACAPPAFRPVDRAGEATVSRFTGRWSHVYLIAHPDAAILVDSGSPVDCDALHAALAVAPPVRAVILTHGHADHAGCAHELQRAGAMILLGAGDAPAAVRGTNAPLAPTGLLGAALAPLFMFPFSPFSPDRAITAPADLGALGFPEVHVAPAPGHTPGALVATVGDLAFVGDLLKGGEVFAHTPMEHLYQSDRAGDHAAIAQVLARGPVALWPGHGGRLAATDTGAWLAGADLAGRDAALTVALDGRGEFPGGGTGGLAARVALGGAVAYAAGAEVRAGDVAGARLTVDADPIGVALRGAGGARLDLTAGVGAGGARGLGGTRAGAAVALEWPVAGARLLGRARLGWRLGGPAWSADALGVADELAAEVGVRLGGDAPWGVYRAGVGPTLSATFADEGGVRRYGVALGVALTTERRVRP